MNEKELSLNKEWNRWGKKEEKIGENDNEEDERK